jgi:hypothetical protein
MKSSNHPVFAILVTDRFADPIVSLPPDAFRKREPVHLRSAITGKIGSPVTIRQPHVPKKLTEVYKERLGARKLPQLTDTLRGPVCLFLVREDGASGSQLAKEVVGSFSYWDLRSAHFFDGVFLGWGFDGVPAFNDDYFLQCVEDLEYELDWNYRGGAHLLLTDLLYDTKSRQGLLDFSQTIPLDISALFQEKKLAQLSPLIEEMIAPVRSERGEKADTSVLEIIYLRGEP